MGSDKGAHGCAVRERAGAAFARVATRRLRPAFKVGGSERRQNRASHSGIRTRGQFLVAAAKPRIGRAVHSHTPLSSRVSRIPFRLSPSPRPSVPTFPRSTVFYFSLSLLRRPFVSLSECLCARWWRRTLTNRTPLDSNELKIPPTFQLEERHTRRGTPPLSALRPPVALFVCCSSLLV